VALLYVTVLVRLGWVDRLPAQAVVLQQRLVTPPELLPVPARRHGRT
jgi:hypothetical protein